MISLLFLISFPFAVAGGQHRFSIKVFTYTDDQFWTNSVIIEGEHEVMLVDAQLTKKTLKKYYRKSTPPKNRCLLSTLPTSMPIIFSVWRFLRRHTPG
jgi:hypothetical protein